MENHYSMEIAGLKRDLPFCKVNDDLLIAAFIMFGDVEITVVSRSTRAVGCRSGA